MCHSLPPPFYNLVSPGFRGLSQAPAEPKRAAALPTSSSGQSLPVALQDPLSDLLSVFELASAAVRHSWDRVPAEVLSLALEARNLPRDIPGGTVSWPGLENAALGGDDVGRAWALLALVRGLEDAAEALSSLSPDKYAGFESWAYSSPLGRIVVAGAGDDEHLCPQGCSLIVDLGGDDVYRGEVASARAPHRLVAAVLDLGGNDHYIGDSATHTQGAGLGGVGILFDLEGDDRYQATDYAQGFGLLGYGLLWDAAGSDSFSAAGGAQGAAVFGGGALVDGAGNDRYSVLGEGQGFGGPWACGILVDAGGDDNYHAQPDPALAPGRADYHSEGRVAANNSQGVGVGRRGDLGDGQAWAGGLGVIADLTGNDSYTAGNFSQGVGYWFGTGMLLDGAGDDRYESVYFSQASGAHYSLALLYDRAGDDKHLLSQEAGASLGYGWDFAASLFIDVSGDDTYRARGTAVAGAELSSVALFLELGGDDRYQIGVPSRSLGWSASTGAGSDSTGIPITASLTSNQVGFFLDLGGNDEYPPGVTSNGREWSRPIPGRGQLGWTRVESGRTAKRPLLGRLRPGS